MAVVPEERASDGLAVLDDQIHQQRV
jgi:hypothetical protein